ncbi:PaaX family transcriptional regulator [Gemmobacter lutimaris]|uniref:PaaX family transcriptional regulator n=1 Tax=Gemmobacter lutimaris TaxID=2306023 RepID=A0A398BS50_9RHOB|nr:PaaX family transcriptional regulator C-terminal domain-containing protein [Gemmobacter lutimaris]RID93252.1 PaaX family transcriptional regulator [Gemmobacter lutimaris]
MAETLITTLRDGLALRAPAMIVTIYGDVVVPRGGVLWMGTLIEIGAALGFSETLVRTAVSRLVAAGQLVGEREGRRSFYRLAEGARQEFSAAARLLYGKPVPAMGWQFHHAPGLSDDAARRGALARVGADLWLRPDHPGFAAPGLCFLADPPSGQGDLPALAATLWPLDRHAADYRAMIAQFAPLCPRLAAGGALPPAAALVARLLLVHAYRGALLRDPRLPEAALPDDWPGEAARTLFAQLYRALSPAADSYIGTRFEGGAGLLPARTAETQARLLALAED